MDENLLLFNELLKENSDSINDSNIQERCLISNEILDSNFIKLDCGHSFNYQHLYKEIVYQKTKRILDNYYLKLNEIKCPYCRAITNKLLPYYKYYNFKYIKGVNGPFNLTMNLNKCQHIITHKGTNTREKCNNSACITKYGIFCNKHLKYTKDEDNLLNNFNLEKYKYLNKMKVKELKEELKNYKLKVSGLKKELIERLIIKKCQLDEFSK